MEMPRWNPPQTYTQQEEFLMGRLGRTRKLFAFLRAQRQALFDEAFQAELATMYRATGAGKTPLPPALLAMVLLLQAYLGVSDAEAVELSLMDRRWQLVLDCLDASEPPFSQGALGEFRARLIRTDMDRRLLERTVELARQSRGFDARKLPKTLRVAFDASALEGAGRVEDTLNLLGHAARKVVGCVAVLLGWTVEQVARQAGIPVLLAPSVKAGLDVVWTAPQALSEALQRLVGQLAALETWVARHVPPSGLRARSARTWPRSSSSARRILSPSRRARASASARGWRPTGGSRLRSRRCATGAKARPNASTAISGILRLSSMRS